MPGFFVAERRAGRGATTRSRERWRVSVSWGGMENDKIRTATRDVGRSRSLSPPTEGRPDFWFAESSSARASIDRLNQVGSTPNPKARPRSAGLRASVRRSRRMPASRDLASNPWQWKQVSDMIGRMSRLNETGRWATGAAPKRGTVKSEPSRAKRIMGAGRAFEILRDAKRFKNSPGSIFRRRCGLSDSKWRVPVSPGARHGAGTISMPLMLVFSRWAVKTMLSSPSAIVTGTVSINARRAPPALAKTS